MDVACEGELTDLLKNAPLQFFQLSTMSAAEKLALKKRLRVELAHVRSATQSIKSECERKPGQVFPSVTEDGPTAVGNGSGIDDGGANSCHGFDRQLSLTSVSSYTKFGKTNPQMFNSADYVSVDVDMVAADNSEARSGVTASAKCRTLQRLECQGGRRRSMDRDKMKQCATVLRKLMNHPTGWVFNQPVDPARLNIPDYFTIISRPMDLGTIKSKLETQLYSDTRAFAADIRLTFSNAMRYNPPTNDVHIMAKALNTIFNARWKALEAKWGGQGVSVQQPIMKKTAVQKQTHNKPKKGAELVKKSAYCLSLVPRRRAMTSADKQRLRKDLAKISDGNMPPELLSFLRRFGSLGQDRDKIRVDIDAFDDDTAWELHRIIRSYLDPRLAKHAAGVEGGPDRRSLSNDLCTEVDSERSSSPPVSSQNAAAAATRDQRGNSDPDTGAASIVDEESMQPSPHRSAVDDSSRDGGRDLLQDGQLSPSKALRAARLRSRFAETILKAQEKTLPSQGERVDLVKMTRQREEMERRQREEKARLEAQVRAAEAACLRAEAEAKKKREMEREAARLALQNMEKTVVIDENTEILKDLEMFGYSQTILGGSHHFSSSTSPGDKTGSPLVDGVDGFTLLQGGGNPLEQLGLFMKDEDMEEEDEPASATQDCTVLRKDDVDVEEGEIGP